LAIIVHRVTGIAIAIGTTAVHVGPAIIDVVALHRLIAAVINHVAILVGISVIGAGCHRVADYFGLSVGIIRRIGITDI
jgi:hypothetical protein